MVHEGDSLQGFMFQENRSPSVTLLVLASLCPLATLLQEEVTFQFGTVLCVA